MSTMQCREDHTLGMSVCEPAAPLTAALAAPEERTAKQILGVTKYALPPGTTITREGVLPTGTKRGEVMAKKVGEALAPLGETLTGVGSGVKWTLLGAGALVLGLAVLAVAKR